MRKSTGIQTEDVAVFSVLRRWRDQVGHVRRTVLNTDWDINRRQPKPETEILTGLVSLIPDKTKLKHFMRNPFDVPYIAQATLNNNFLLMSNYRDLIDQFLLAGVEVTNEQIVLEKFLKVVKNPLVYFTPYWEYEPVARYSMDTYLFIYALVIDQTMSPVMARILIMYLLACALILESKEAYKRNQRSGFDSGSQGNLGSLQLEEFDPSISKEIDYLSCVTKDTTISAERFFVKFVEAWGLWRNVPLKDSGRNGGRPEGEADLEAFLGEGRG